MSRMGVVEEGALGWYARRVSIGLIRTLVAGTR